jgi:hypothetical protein
MKTKKTMKYLLIVAIIGIVFVSCKKNKDTTVAPVDEAPAQSLAAADQTNVENESNACLDEANSALQGVSTRSADAFSFPSCAHISVDTTNASIGKLVLTYNGNNCANTRYRTGSITIQLPYSAPNLIRWHVAGATVTITFNGYTVKRLSDNKSLTFNGSHSITNVSGGLLVNITPSSPKIHKIRANMQLTFDDGTTRTWNVARTRTFTLTDTIVSEKITGDTTVGGYNSVAMWGVNRAGNNFYTSVTTPVVADIFGGTCLYRPRTGVRVHYGLAHPITVTYGIQSNGNPTPAGTCPDGYKVTWTNGQGASVQIIKSY